MFCSLELGQEPPGDDQLEDLTGTLTDTHQPGVAPVALHRVVLDVAIAPQNLNSFVADPARRFRGEQLSLGDARLMRIGEGTSEILKLIVPGGSLCMSPKG